MSAVFSVFVKAMTAVGTAASMAMAGIILHRFGNLDGKARKILSYISMNLTIPALLFSNMLNCPTSGKCPAIQEELKTAWPFLVLPFIWVSVGAICGTIAANVSCPPPELRRTIIAAASFGNSTGLPIVILSAISRTRALSSTASAEEQYRHCILFLSIYQVTYPILQWSVGGFLLKAQKPTTEMCKLKEPLVFDEDILAATQRSLLFLMQKKTNELLETVLVPPVIAVLAGLVIASCPSLKILFVGGEDNHMPLEFVLNGITAFGMAAVPLNMLILGVSLSDIPGFSAIHWPSTLGIVIVKLILCPAIVCALVASFGNSFFAGSMVSDMRSYAIFVACLLTCTPTANNMMVMAEVSGGRTCKQVLATTIFVMYCLAPLTLTCWIVVFLRLGMS